MSPVAGASRQIGDLDTALIHRLERLRLIPRSLRTAHTRGERLVGKGGASTDFADYREYVPGDDMRAIDWNAFMRLRRPYLKTFRREEDRHLVVILDCSRSMSFGGKLAFAKRVGSALAVMALAANDRVSVWAPGAVAGDRLVAPVRGRQALGRVLSAIAALSDDARGTPLTEAIRTVAARHSGRGAALVLSDLLVPGEARHLLGRVASLGLEIMAIQVLSPAEIDPDLSGDLRLLDSESGEYLDISSEAGVLDLYRQQRQRWSDGIASWCAAAGGRFCSCSSMDPLEDLLFNRLRGWGWLA